MKELAKWAGIRGEAAEADNARLVAFLQFNRSGLPRQAGPTLQEIAAALADKEGT